MPYIPGVERDAIDDGVFPASAGHLNYAITSLIAQYWEAHGHKYQTINDIVGAMESAKAEFQRRVVAPYEDKKIKDNGDVY